MSACVPRKRLRHELGIRKRRGRNRSYRDNQACSVDSESSTDQPKDKSDHNVLPTKPDASASAKGEKSEQSSDEPNKDIEPPESVKTITWLEYVLAGTNIA